MAIDYFPSYLVLFMPKILSISPRLKNYEAVNIIFSRRSLVQRFSLLLAFSLCLLVEFHFYLGIFYPCLTFVIVVYIIYDNIIYVFCPFMASFPQPPPPPFPLHSVRIVLEVQCNSLSFLLKMFWEDNTGLQSNLFFSWKFYFD